MERYENMRGIAIKRDDVRERFLKLLSCGVRFIGRRNERLDISLRKLTPSYETRRLVECFDKEGIECFFVHPNNVDIFISKDNRKSVVLVENEHTSIL